MGSSVILPTPGQPLPMRPDEFKSGSIPSIVTFDWRKLNPPSNLYIQRDDVLQIRAFNSIAGLSFDVRYRLLLPPIGTSRQAQPEQAAVPLSEDALVSTVSFGSSRFTPTSARGENDFTIPLAEGFLLSVDVFTVGALTQRGQCFVEIGIVRSVGAIPQLVETLVADYLTGASGIGWPFGRIISPVEEAGASVVLSPANPAAGADVSIIVPGGARWRGKSLRAVLTTSAAVANRSVSLEMDDGVGAHTFCSIPQNFQQTASLTRIYTFGLGCAQFQDLNQGEFVAPIPENLLPAGFRVRTATQNLQAGDQWSVTELLVEEWISNP